MALLAARVLQYWTRRQAPQPAMYAILRFPYLPWQAARHLLPWHFVGSLCLCFRGFRRRRCKLTHSMHVIGCSVTRPPVSNSWMTAAGNCASDHLRPGFEGCQCVRKPKSVEGGYATTFPALGTTTHQSATAVCST